MAPTSPFEKAFGRLVEHLQKRPDDALRTRRLVRRAAKAVSRDTVRIEAGLVLRGPEEGPPLQSRLHARGLEAIVVSAGAGETELLALGSALTEDEGELPAGELIELIPVVEVRPGTTEVAPAPAQAQPPDVLPALDTEDIARAPRLPGDLAAQRDRLVSGLETAATRGAWTEALHAAQALTHLAGYAPDAQRKEVGIGVRRLLTAPLLRSFIDHAARTPEERARTAEVLVWMGREAGEVLVDALRESGSVGPLEFLLEVVPDIPDVRPMAEALLRGDSWYEVRLGALLLGRLGDPDAVPLLAAALESSDPRARSGVVEGLGALKAPAAVDPLGSALRDPDPGVRVSAAQALAAVQTGGVVMVLAGALAEEGDAGVRQACIAALGAIDSSEAAVVLANTAAARRGLLRRPAFSEAERVSAVEALRAHRSRGARSALERLAADDDPAVRTAARAALEPGGA